MFNQLHEECGVFGIFNKNGKDLSVVSSAYYGLFALQHRGQESAGIAVNDDGLITCYKDLGLVNEVFSERVLNKFEGNDMAVGHVRYSTTGEQGRENAQPIVVNHIKGCMALAHNGNLTNAAELRQELEMSGAIFHSTSDTEVIAYEITKQRITSSSIEEAVGKTMKVLKGAYSLVIMSPSKLMAVRDPYGFRPLCMGKIGESIVFASETCALDSVGAEFIRDIEPGEIVVVDKNGVRSTRDNCIGKSAMCIFEFIYFARPDSVIDGSNVHEARRLAGRYLYDEYKIDADVVIGVPDSGINAAMGYAEASGIPYGIGFVKNKYIGRTFIQPIQTDRENKVRIKLNAVKSVVEGKRVVMIDDSIVRGTTSARIVKLLRDAGAKEVHMMVSAPPFKHACYFGTDIDSEESLIANNHTIDEIRDMIGVDSLSYIKVEDVIKIAKYTKLNFCDGCFTGNYPVAPPEKSLKSKFMRKKGERESNE